MSLKKIFPILSVTKYQYSINAPTHHMMKSSRGIKSCCLGVQKSYPTFNYIIKLFWNQHPLLRKFHESREDGEASAEREQHPFLSGLWPAAVQDLPQNKQNRG